MVRSIGWQQQRELKQLNKRVNRASTQVEKTLKKLNSQEFACEKRRVAQMFEGVDLLTIRQGSRIVEQKVLKLTPVRQQLTFLFGPPIQNCYLVEF